MASDGPATGPEAGGASDLIRGYSAALLLAAAAFALWHLGINRVGVSPYFLYLAAVTVASWLYGLGPGLLVAGLGIVAANFAYAFPGWFVLAYPRGLLQSILFLFVAITVSWLNTERRSLLRSERSIRRRFERLAAEQAAMLGQMTEAVIVADLTGHVRYLNEAAQRILGVETEAGSPRPGALTNLNVSFPDGRPVPSEDAALVRAGRGERIANAERSIRRADGARADLVVNARQVRDRHGTVLGVVATIRDVTVEHRLEREKEAILSTVVHDLKNPLTTIKGLAALLSRQIRRMELPEEASAALLKNLEGIDTKGNEMLVLMDEFMAAARNAEGAGTLEPRPGDLIALVRRCVETRATASVTHTIRLESAVPALPGRWDAAQLERAIDNLIGNATKYSPEGGEITVTIRREGDGCQAEAVVAVRDRGIGIPEDDQKRVFEHFFRAHNVADIGGTGVGLAGVKRVVELHGGAISLASREGQGTTVEVRLPLHVPEGPPD